MGLKTLPISNHNSPKGDQMDTINHKRFIQVMLTAALFALSNAAFSEELQSHDSFIIQEFQTALLSYELTRDRCANKWKNTNEITIPIEMIQKLEFTNKRQLFNTINYYLHVNQNECLGPDIKNVVYSINVLKEKFSNPRDGKIKKLHSKVVNTVLPSATTLEAQIFFDSLPLKSQKTLNQLLLGKLYDVNKINNFEEIKSFYFDSQGTLSR